MELLMINSFKLNFKTAMFVSKKEYNENGYGIINDKFF